MERALLYRIETADIGLETNQYNKAVYGICSKNSNSMKSPNPNSGIYEAETTRTLDSQGGNPSCNQGGIVIVGEVAGFNGWKSVSGSIQYKTDTAPTIETSMPPNIVILNDQGGTNITVEKLDISPTLRSETRGNLPVIAKEIMALHESISGDRVYISDIAYALRSGKKPMLIEEINLHPNIAPTLTASAGGTSRPGGGQGNELDYYVAYAIQGNMIGRAEHNGPQGNGINENNSFTLNTIDRHAIAYFNYVDNRSIPIQNNIATCQLARQHKGCPVDLVVETVNADGGFSKYKEGTFGTLTQSGGETGGGSESLIVISVEPLYIVRRLTPLECERLQGFPDNWTKYGANSEKEISDTQRYKALGNSVAIPCVRFVLKGIVDGEKIKA
ncbi:MAG: DNA cytosine methyltransferase [Defluviitaleaceae bacterium]|nr:DNA cytosine methyltransferase [Defluviitaleaceae bacterium]